MKEPGASRLMRLRQLLGYNQRRLAQEFRVSPGAIANWEIGDRSIPGPILRLIEIYEEHLGHGNPEIDVDLEFADLSGRMAEDIFTVARGKKSPEIAKQKNFVRRGLQVYLKSHFGSYDSIGRKIRLALVDQLVSTLGATHGLPMKVAQIASYLDPTVSPEIRDVLSALQDQARPIPAGEADRVIERELGARPRQIFDEWSPRPFAAASIGQVHRAKLKSGEVVAVKIQYPGVADRIQRNFKALSFIQVFRALTSHSEDSIFAEIRDRVLEECDYQLEADNQDKFRSSFSGDPEVLIPRTFRELSTSRVLTMEYIAGQTLADFATNASQELKNRAGEILTRFHSESIFFHHLLQGDPHPGNYLFLENKICFLDFGRIKNLDQIDVAFNRSFYKSIMLDDPTTGRRLLREHNLVKCWDRFDFDGFWRAIRTQEHHHLVDGRFRFSTEYVIQQMAAAKSFRGWRELRLDSRGLWAICINASLWNILARLEAESNWRDSGLAILIENEKAVPIKRNLY